MLIRTQMDLGPFTFLGTDKLIQLTERDKALLKRQVEAAIKLTRKEGTERVANQEGTYALGRVVGLGTVTGRMETRRRRRARERPRSRRRAESRVRPGLSSRPLRPP